MFVARILYPVKVLGPGNRVGIWMAGCSRGCPGCSNPELWEQKEEWRTDPETVCRLIRGLAESFPVDGITVTGGEPFLQAEELTELLGNLKGVTEDVLVYSGFRKEELEETCPAALKGVAVLVDGPYVEEKNTGDGLAGSGNQRIYYLKEEYRKRYEEYLSGDGCGRIQNFSVSGGIVSVGIHRPGYPEELKKKAEEKGLEEQNGGNYSEMA